MKPLLLALLVLCLLCPNLDALRRKCPPPPSFLPPPEGSFEIGGGAILWAPWLTRFQFARSVRVSGVFRRCPEFYIRPNFHGGFQIFASWNECQEGRFVQGVWTYFGHKDKFKALGGDFIYYTGEGQGIAATNVLGKVWGSLNRATLRFGSRASYRCDTSLYGFLGLQFINLEQTRLSRGVESSGARHFDSQFFRFTGGGACLGVGGEYHVFSVLTLYAELAVVAAVGGRKVRYEVDELNLSGALVSKAVYKEAAQTFFVPGTETRIAASFRYCTCGLQWIADLGWEFDYYFNILAFREPLRNPNVTFDEGIAFCGPYGSFKVRF